jgi:hypothetical protein
MKGSFIRSKAKWIDEGEKPTKYFCNLEKQHSSSKTIPYIINNNGHNIYDQNEILAEAASYYKTLYSKGETKECDNAIFDELNLIHGAKLNNDEAQALEGILTMEEISTTLKNMKHFKSPGSDGFTTEFFKVFWKDLKYFILRSLNYAFISGTMSITQKQGIITCIPKENKPRTTFNNLRPLTLLNVVYKIASGTIANRLKTVLDKLISKDQTGFIKGRYIGENTRLLYDILKYTEDNKIPGLLLTLDFEKAFDSLAFNFIEKTLIYFNFGPMFRKWISLFLYNTMSAIQINGFLSESFKIEKGCRQGDPISSYIFILCAETLAIKIRNSKQIKGITIENIEYKISQFADDTSLLLDGSESSLNTALDLLHTFALESGLKINYDKTKLIWIGSKKYSTHSIKTKYKLIWGSTNFKVLGIIFDVNLEKMIDYNYSSKLTMLQNIINFWKRRNISPLGKITVVKSMLLPLFTHLFIALPSPGVHILNQIHNCFYNFIWDGPLKIKHNILIKPYEEGGLNMIDIYSFEKSMKLTWIKKLALCTGKCFVLVYSLFDVKKMLNMGNAYVQKIVKRLTNTFWKDVLNYYSIYVNTFKICTFDDVLNMPLFYNDNFKIGMNCIYDKNMYERGIRLVRDILCTSGGFKTKNDIENYTGKVLNFLFYEGVKRTVSDFIKKSSFATVNKSNTTGVFFSSYLNVIVFKAKPNKSIYSTYTFNKEKPTCQNKWNEIFNNIDWKFVHNFVFENSRDTYIQWLQTRIVHRILGTKSLLYKMKIVNDNLCSFCKKHEETLTHLFWECEHIQPIINYIKYSMNLNNINFPNISCQDVLLGICSEKMTPINILFLEMKRYVFICKKHSKIPTVPGLKNSFQLAWEIQKHTICQGSEFPKWSVVRLLLNEPIT